MEWIIYAYVLYIDEWDEPGHEFAYEANVVNRHVRRDAHAMGS